MERKGYSNEVIYLSVVCACQERGLSDDELNTLNNEFMVHFTIILNQESGVKKCLPLELMPEFYDKPTKKKTRQLTTKFEILTDNSSKVTLPVGVNSQ